MPATPWRASPSSARAATRDGAGFWRPAVPAFCAFAQALEQALRAQGWPALLPLECIHQQSSQQFARWGEALAQALGEPLVLDYVPRVPPTTALTLVARQDYPEAAAQVAAILRFAWPAQGLGERLRGLGLAHFAAGDLVGIVPPGSACRATTRWRRAGGRVSGNLRAPDARRPVLHAPAGPAARGHRSAGLHPFQPRLCAATHAARPWC
jgi:hypothetical protein